MSTTLPRVFLARHGETAWSRTGQHTGRTDIPLTAEGERQSALLGKRLAGHTFAAVFTSPLQRARRTAELAGFPNAVVDPELGEWDYGDCEGLPTSEIRQLLPSWNLFVHGCPGGETVDAVSHRADRVLARIRAIKGDVLIVSHGHFSRVLGVRWLGLTASNGQLFLFSPAALSILGHDHNANEPVVVLWNDNHHVSAK